MTKRSLRLAVSVTPHRHAGGVSAFKVCTKCSRRLPLDDFYRMAATKDARRPDCKACVAARRKAWYAANRDREIARVQDWQDANRDQYGESQRTWRTANPELKRRIDREGHLRRKFGITQGDYDRMLEAQGFGCGICGDVRPGGRTFHVDHDHVTGEVRGLLCVKCNQGIGLLRENPALLHMAVEYLQSPRSALMERMEQTRLARQRLEGLSSSR